MPHREPPNYQYRNLSGRPAVLDHAASVILSDYYFYLAAEELNKGNHHKALEYIKEVATLSDGLKEEMNNLGTLLAEYGLDTEAILYYEKSAKLDKKYLTPRWNLAHLFKSQGDVLLAIQVFNDLAQLDPDDFRIFGELGFLLKKNGNLDLAIKNWSKSLALNPNQPQIIKAISTLTGPE